MIMSDYYCHQCSVERGYLNPTGLTDLNLTGTTYLLEKCIKHIQQPTDTRITSVYNEFTYDYYRTSTLNALASGFTMIDDSNRINVIWKTGYDNGITYKGCKPLYVTDAVKVVYPTNFEKIHSFPFYDAKLVNAVCSGCRQCIQI